MYHPVKGAFIAWSDGPRLCPGKKFSQVEFVAVIARLMWKHRLEVVPTEGENVDAARKRVLEVARDSDVHLTLKMRRPMDMTIRWLPKA